MYNIVDEELKSQLIDTFKNFDWKNICPAFAQNNIAICMASSNEYSPFISVVMRSILDNAKQTDNFDFLILHKEISNNNQKLIISSIGNADNVSVRFINIAEYVSDVKFYTWAHFTEITYYRLFIPYIFYLFPKILYLDSDVIVNYDIAELYNTDLTGYLMGAARDTHVIARAAGTVLHHSAEYYIKTLALENPENYFQCGVSLYNIREIGREFPDGRFIAEGASRTLRWLDQDLLNVLLAGRVKILPNYWNVMIFNNFINIDEYYLTEPYYSEYFAARENPRIIHYVGRCIPCYNPSADMYWYFWVYARKTPFYELLLARMMDEKQNSLKGHTDSLMSAHQYHYHKRFMSKVKARIIMPVVNLLFPASTRRRQGLKNFYFKLRGWK